MSTIDPAEVLTRHKEHWSECVLCHKDWPCDAAQLATALQESQTALHDLRAQSWYWPYKDAQAAGVMAFEAGVKMAHYRDTWKAGVRASAAAHRQALNESGKWQKAYRKERKRRKAAETALWHHESWETRAQAAEERVGGVLAALAAVEWSGAVGEISAHQQRCPSCRAFRYSATGRGLGHASSCKLAAALAGTERTT